MITTERLFIRPLETSDTSQVAKVWGNGRVMAYCGGAAGEERLGEAVERCRACQEEHGFSPFAVLTLVDSTLIGICGFKSLPDPEGVELIYHFVPEVWGHGYATEAACAVLRWARNSLRIRYAEASFDVRNLASRNVLVKSGFTFLEDRWYDDVQQTEPVYRIDLTARQERTIP